MTARALLVLTACIPLLITASPAAATPSPLQAEVERLLDLTPGGIQLDDRTISWDDGQVIVTVAAPTEMVARAIASCPTGYYCAWTASGYTGSSIWLASCSVGGSTNSLAPLGAAARSFANARTSGTVKVKNGSSVVDTLTPSSGRSSVTYASTAMVCFT
jgi:hypothetical protein